MKEILNYILNNNLEYIKYQNKNVFVRDNIYNFPFNVNFTTFSKYNTIDSFYVKFNKNLKEFNFIYI